MTMTKSSTITKTKSLAKTKSMALMENVAPEVRLQMVDGRELRISQGSGEILNLSEFIEHPLTIDPYPLFTVLNQCGEALEKEERFSDAGRLYQEAARLAEAAGHRIWTALELNNYGVAMRRAGHLDAAMAAYEDAVGRLHDDRPDLPDAADRKGLLSLTLGNIAAIHAFKGEKRIARRFLLWAMEMAGSGKDPVSSERIAQCKALLAQIDHPPGSGAATG
jgi:tetratricopeptide (TPR) repeat protein